MSLLERLSLIQSASALSDDQFAGKLGISTTQWIFIKQGKRDMGVKVLKGVMRTYPELKQNVINFLTDPRQATSAVA